MQSFTHSNAVRKNLFRLALRQEARLQAHLRRQALRLALDQAYTGFARRQPRWANSLFDRYFLHRVAGPLVEGALQQAGCVPAPADLARAWLTQLGPAAARLEHHLPEITTAAADFLAGLEAELGHYPNLPATVC